MKRPARIGIGALGLMIALIVGICRCIYTETNALEVSTFAIRHKGLSAALPGAKIALLSDLHIRRYGAREERILAVLEAEKPDLVLLAGDYIHSRGSFDPARKFFSRLQAPLGIFAVLGNTDYSNENGTCILCHERNSGSINRNAKPKFLRNECVVLKRGGKAINLIGLDDPVSKRRSGRMKNRDFEETLKSVDPELPSMLLVHSPEAAPEVAGRVDLVLAGHNHGGQVRFLDAARRIFRPEPADAYLEGFFEKCGTVLYVSRGIGRSSLPFRFGAKPQATFFRIENAPAPAKATWYETKTETFYPQWDGQLLIDTFNPLPFLGKKLRAQRSMKNVLFDFESDAELRRMNRQCRTRLHRACVHATSGAYSLEVKVGAGNRGLQLVEFRSDWTAYEFLKLDIFQPQPTTTPLCIRIDDSRSLDNPRDHLDMPLDLKQGPNRIGIPLKGLRTNRGKRLLDLRRIKRMTLYSAVETTPLKFYLDNVRLE